MMQLEPKVLGKMSDSRLLNHFKACRTYIRNNYRDYHYYGCGLSEKEKAQLAVEEGYVEMLKVLLSTRKHVPRKAK